MPIISSTTSPKKPDNTKKVDSPQITDPNYKGVTVDTRQQPLNSLLTYIEGSSWVVKYYQQLLGENSEVSPQQLDLDPVYQQYIEISQLELKVTGNLSQSQDDESKAFEVTGEAHVYPPIRPNTGDMFLADVGDGREAVFAVTETTKLTILQQSCFRISYILVSYSTEERRRDLESKTVKRTHFVKKLLEHGADPIVVNDDYHRYLSFTNLWDRLIGQYFGAFFNKTISTLAVPDQECLTYDPFLVKGILSFMETNDCPILREIKTYSVGLPDITPPVTVWDALMRFSIDLLPLAQEKLGLVSSQAFGTIPQFESIHFTKVDLVVYPVDYGVECFEFESMTPGLPQRWDIRHQFQCTTVLGSLEKVLDVDASDGNELHDIHPVTKDDYYIFTEAFYFNYKDRQSRLEKLVRDTLVGCPIDQKTLSKLCEDSIKWGRLEKFYYIPILLLLIKMVRRGH